MMESQELLMFRNYSGIDEPAFSTPIGFVSIRNAIVFVIFAAISFGLHKLIMPEDVQFPQDLPLIGIVLFPLIFGILLVAIKPQIGSADTILLSIICMIRNKNKKEKISIQTEKNKKKKSSVLGFAKLLKKEKVNNEDIIQEIVCSDLDELKGFKIQLHQGNGAVLADTLVRCYIDDELVDTIKTAFDGFIIIKIRPESIGKKQLTIRDDQDKIILQKTLLFKKNVKSAF